LVFITEMKSVYSVVRTGSLNKAVCASSVKGQFRDASKRDGTRAETRFGLSAKRASPFKSAGGGGVGTVDSLQRGGGGPGVNKG